MKYDAENCLKIFDFGLARDATAEVSTMGEIGTPGYMAPELFEATKGGKVVFDTAVDTYAFGATLLAIALGKLPAPMKEAPPKLPCSSADFAKLTISLPSSVTDILNRCLSQKPDDRPSMAEVATIVGRHLLQNKHRAILVSKTSANVLDASNPVAVVSVRGQGSLKIAYDGFQFVVSDVAGDVSINNIPVTNDYFLPGSCVIVLGSAALGPSRTFITVDVSHPEVSL